MKRLIDLQKDTAGPDRYAMASSYAWLQVKGQELAMGVLEMLATIANIGDDHWIALILDFKSLTILCGDSMGGTIDEDIERALTWWIQHHTRKHFTTSCLPITCWQDSHSCGILAWVALAAFLFLERNALVEARVVADKRLRMSLQVADCHNEMVHSYCDLRDLVTNKNQSFEANSEGHPFTFQASDPGSSDDKVEISESPLVMRRQLVAGLGLSLLFLA